MIKEETKEILETIFSVILFILFVGGGLIYFIRGIDLGFIRSEITAYPIQKGEALPSITSKVYPEQQNIVALSEDKVIKLKDCVIKDRKNWHCDTDSYYPVEIGFSDGNYLDPSFGKDVRFVSKREWIWSPKYDDKYDEINVSEIVENAFK